MESGDAADLFTKLFETDWDWKPPVEELAILAVAPKVVDVWTGFGEEIPPASEILSPAEFELGATSVIVPIFSPQNYFEELRKAVENAEESVWIQQQYIK